MPAALTTEQKLVRNQLIEAAHRRNPRGDFATVVRQATAQTRQLLGLSEAISTDTNALNNTVIQDGEDDVGGNNFEAFLQAMIVAIARDAAASGKVNPAYVQLAADLARAQAISAGGVQRSSYVNPAAGSTPIGRTESARVRQAVQEALTYADLALPAQQEVGAPQTAATKDKPLADMTAQELQLEAAVRFGALASSGALRSPYYRSAA